MPRRHQTQHKVYAQTRWDSSGAFLRSNWTVVESEFFWGVNEKGVWMCFSTHCLAMGLFPRQKNDFQALKSGPWSGLTASIIYRWNRSHPEEVPVEVGEIHCIWQSSTTRAGRYVFHGLCEGKTMGKVGTFFRPLCVASSVMRFMQIDQKLSAFRVFKAPQNPRVAFGVNATLVPTVKERVSDAQ